MRRGGGGDSHTNSSSLLPAGGGGQNTGSTHNQQHHHHHRTTVRISGKLFLRSTPVWDNNTSEEVEGNNDDDDAMRSGLGSHNDDDGKRRNRGVGRVTFTLYDPQSTGCWRVVATDTMLSALDLSLDLPTDMQLQGSKQGSRQGSRQPSRHPSMERSPTLPTSTTTATATASSSSDNLSISQPKKSTRLPTGQSESGPSVGIMGEPAKTVSFSSHKAGSTAGGGASIAIAVATAAAAVNDRGQGVGGAEGGEERVGGWLAHLSTASQQIIDSAVERTSERLLGDTPSPTKPLSNTLSYALISSYHL